MPGLNGLRWFVFSGCLGCLPTESSAVIPPLRSRIAMISGTSTCHMVVSCLYEDSFFLFCCCCFFLFFLVIILFIIAENLLYFMKLCPAMSVCHFIKMTLFLFCTLPHDSNDLLWFHVDRPYINLFNRSWIIKYLFLGVCSLKYWDALTILVPKLKTYILLPVYVSKILQDER